VQLPWRLVCLLNSLNAQRPAHVVDNLDWMALPRAHLSHGISLTIRSDIMPADRSRQRRAR
jgi:hypothetical protein